MPIYVQRLEWEAAQAPRYTVREWVDFPGADYRLLDGTAEPLVGLRLLPAPGHTPGHQVVVVEGAGGAVLIAGQAAETRAEFDLAPGLAPLRRLGAEAVYLSHERP